MKWRASLFCLTLAGCGMVDGRIDGPRRAPARAGGEVKIGRPYTVAGRTYVPADDRGYEAVGIATWYGSEHAGKATANGERFDPNGFTAAHTTLPMPSYVEVTVLATGARTIVRINDRGPFRPDRLIDLSRAAARLLGIERLGSARVRLRRIEPTAAQRAALAAGRPAPMR